MVGWLACTLEQRSCGQSFLALSLNIATCYVQDAAADKAEAAKAAAEARLPPEPADGGSGIGEPCFANNVRGVMAGSCIFSQNVQGGCTTLQSAQLCPSCWPQVRLQRTQAAMVKGMNSFWATG